MTPGLPSLEDVRAELARRRLHAYVKLVWPIVEPRAPFVDNWHIGFICEHLEAVTAGQLGDIVLNIPPGCMKSYLVSVFWPTWEWGPQGKPHLRYLCGSYDDDLSIRDARRARDIIKSDVYQRHWPLRLRADQDMKTRFDNVKSGWRIATSVGGKGTGEHPHRKIIDDPHNVKQSLSKAKRDEAITWFDLTMGSRGLALDAVTVVIMQRLHEEDLTGHILDTLSDQFTHICLPMRYEPPAWVEVSQPDGAVTRTLTPRMPETPLGQQDPRQDKGELLWPALFGEEKVAKLEAQLTASHGEFGVAGQLQQRPVPEAGGLFKREWFVIVDARPAPAEIVARTRGWDCAGTDGGGDYTVGCEMALTKGGLVYVEDVVRGQWGPDDFEGENGIFAQTVMLDGGDVRQREEQEPGSAGKKVIAAHEKLVRDLSRRVNRILDYEGVSGSGDKVTKSRPFRAQCAIGNVRLFRGPWNKAFIDELCDFPNGSYDDQVDGASVAYNDLALVPMKPSGGTWGR